MSSLRTGISDLNLWLAHHTLLAGLDTTNLPPERAREISGVPTARFCPSDEPRLLPRNKFLDTAPTVLPRPQILQPQSACYAFGTSSA